MSLTIESGLLLALALINVCLLLALWWRKPAPAEDSPEQALRRQQLLEAVTSGHERLERELRREVTESARAGRIW